MVILAFYSGSRPRTHPKLYRAWHICRSPRGILCGENTVRRVRASIPVRGPQVALKPE